MAAVDFPNSPTVGDIYTTGDISRKWDGTTWSVIATTITGPTGATGPDILSATTPIVWDSGSRILSFATSPTITTPTINTINTSFTTTGTASLWDTGITTGTISVGAALTTGTLSLATGGTGITNINIGHTNALIGITGSTTTITGNLTITGTLDTALTTAGIVTTTVSGVIGSTATVPVANGGTGTATAGIAAFNNITGYTAAGATGTTSTNLVFSTSPTLTTPVITTPQLQLETTSRTTEGSMSWDSTNDYLRIGNATVAKSFFPFDVNATAKTGAYTLATTDYNTLVQMNGAFAFTVGTGLSAAPVGTQIHLLALTAGVSVAASSTTIYYTPGLKLRAQYSTATLICLASNVWLLTGDLSA